jgi:septum formation protein
MPFPGALIIGSDQVAAQGASVMASRERAPTPSAQLRAMRGREIVFHTGLCLLDAANGMRLQARCIDIHVGFRELSDAEIEAYLDKEDALNCAGSAKSEGLGISLLTYLRGDDPNALVGLPLIALCDMLRKAGVALP